MKRRLFQYVVLRHYPETNETDGKSSEILISPGYEIARDEKSLAAKLVRQLPEDVMEDFENVEIIVRPF